MASKQDTNVTTLRAATGIATPASVADLEFARYSSLSGLTPVNKFSLADHKKACGVRLE